MPLRIRSAARGPRSRIGRDRGQTRRRGSRSVREEAANFGGDGLHDLVASGQREKLERLGVTRPEVHFHQPGRGPDVAILDNDRIDSHAACPVRFKRGGDFLSQDEV
jgi:hypothetical protein